VIRYQWQFHGTNLPNATNSTFTLTNVQVSDDGDYGVVVTVVTNAPVAPATFSATLAVLGPPILSNPQFLSNRNFQMLLQGTRNRSYVIEISSTLTNWSTLATVNYTNGQMPVTDSSATNAGQRFYRARLAL
jgi:hypothetical protein